MRQLSLDISDISREQSAAKDHPRPDKGQNGVRSGRGTSRLPVGQRYTESLVQPTNPNRTSKSTHAAAFLVFHRLRQSLRHGLSYEVIAGNVGYEFRTTLGRVDQISVLGPKVKCTSAWTNE